MKGGMACINAYGSANQFHCNGVVSGLKCKYSQQVQCLGVVRLHLDDLSIGLLGWSQLALLVKVHSSLKMLRDHPGSGVCAGS